ncbi:hypothetical protein HGO97_015485 [Faecalicatena sp. AGMB00832]|uniref:Lipoprotein n=1 Tax=Faecalicatena faecalis TaxID=2726362 RepID=A0ABS6D6H8_9FIRM|nr:hypothetical protein [Faecalicatena faecalis]MBU3877207.1 hypothetical protein [Faecalicatena faecalis]
MMLKQFKILTALCLAVIVLSGCSGNGDSAKDTFDSEYVQMNFAGPARFKEGEFRVIDGLSYYVDYEKAVAVPVCNQPDCRHLLKQLDKESTCNALQDYQIIFPYKGKLYGVKKEEAGELALYASDLDGNNKKRIGTCPAGSGIQDFLLFHSNLYYTTYAIDKDASGNSALDSASDLALVWKLYRMDLDTLDAEEMETFTGNGSSLMFLGGTKDYQIYSAGENSKIDFYRLDYDTGKSKKLPICGNTYGAVIPKKGANAFYYIHHTEHNTDEIHCYDMDRQCDDFCVSEEEIGKELNGSEWSVNLQCSFEQGFLFGAYTQDISDSGVFLKESEKKPLKELALPEQLNRDKGVRFYNFCSESEDGLFFWYVKEEETGRDESGNIMKDTARWYAYIDKDALLAGRYEVKDVIAPQISAMGNPVDKDGNIQH